MVLVLTPYYGSATVRLGGAKYCGHKLPVHCGSLSSVHLLLLPENSFLVLTLDPTVTGLLYEHHEQSTTRYVFCPASRVAGSSPAIGAPAWQRGPKSLRSPCCALAIYNNPNQQIKPHSSHKVIYFQIIIAIPTVVPHGMRALLHLPRASSQGTSAL
ncbi:hypothetical protein PoB_006083400 [Plakobranchus ocellatus]|uniref:Uncharacterized protein n=1 Tax=Plakobranchus ocellatus TaxID=259542 RepID=A0AAV4CR38_9GAST|nr:hypothetical protein PoB_006083400 [Plakobranchus ocellatus]